MTITTRFSIGDRVREAKEPAWGSLGPRIRIAGTVECVGVIVMSTTETTYYVRWDSGGKTFPIAEDLLEAG